QRSNFIDEMDQIVASFELARYEFDTRVSHAEQRVALKELEQLSSQLMDRLRSVDRTTRGKLVASYPASPFPHELDCPPHLEQRRRTAGKQIGHDRWEMLRRDTEHVQRVATAALDALRNLMEGDSSKGGQPARVRALCAAAEKLAAVWERFKRQPYKT